MGAAQQEVLLFSSIKQKKKPGGMLVKPIANPAAHTQGDRVHWDFQYVAIDATFRYNCFKIIISLYNKYLGRDS